MVQNSQLHLHFAQLSNNWKLSKYNRYSNRLKQEYHVHLGELFEKLNNEDLNNLADSDKLALNKIFEFFILSLQFLNSSTLKTVPYELIYCLREAMKEWIEDSDLYIIVTSNNNFSFDSRLIQNNTYDIIKVKYGIEFDRKLVLINLPKHLERDYLANVVLYHELGHFVDGVLNISYVICYNIISSFPRDLIQFFPYVIDTNIDNKEKSNRIYCHLMEYFADIFAAQYVGNTISSYLNYIAGDSEFSPSHPSTAKRIELVNDFINGRSNCLIEVFYRIMEKSGKEKLKNRAQAIDSNDFIKLLPYEIENSNQLHSLFINGWNVWNNGSDKIEKFNKMSFKLSKPQLYEILNNLIEKSINNFIIKKEWETECDN